MMIRSGITFVSRNVIYHRLSGVSLLAVWNVNNPVGLVGLPYVTWSAHFFVTHIQTEEISSWNGPTVHVCCFMLARASTKTFVSRVRKTSKKYSLAEKFVSKGHSLAEVSLYYYKPVHKTNCIEKFLLNFMFPPYIITTTTTTTSSSSSNNSSSSSTQHDAAHTHTTGPEYAAKHRSRT
jgi:hypothetical protein